MAFYKQDIVDVNLETGVIHRSFLNHTIGHKDDDADRFGIRAFRNGEPVDLSGAQCQAIFMAPDGTNIALTSYGTVSGNEAYVTLPQACYNVEGQFCLAIKLVGGGVTATVRIIDGVVDRTGATGAVAPTEAVPTYQEILAVYAEMQEDIADYESVVATQNGKIDDLKSATNAINDAIFVPYKTYQNIAKGEGIGTNGKTTLSNAARCRLNSNLVSQERSYALCLTNDEYVIVNAFLYSENAYASVTRSIGIIPSSSYRVFKTAQNETVIRATFAHADKTTTITDQDVENIKNSLKLCTLTDTSLSIPYAAADAKTTGDLLNGLDVATEYVNCFYPTNPNNRTLACGVDVTFNADGTVTLNGTVAAEGTNYVNLMGGNMESDRYCAFAGETYTVNRTLVSGEAVGKAIMKHGKDYETNPFFLNVPYTFTEDECVILALQRGAVFNNATYQFMIVKGTKMYPFIKHEKTAIDFIARSIAGNIPSKSIKILGIGNSYTRDSLRWLWKILSECGYTDHVVAHGYWGSSTLDQQYESLNPESENHNAFTYWKYTGKDATKTSNYSLDTIIADESWDVVIFQQQSDYAGQYSSFVSEGFDINDFVAYVKSNIETSNLKIGIAQTWSHSHGYTGEKFIEFYGGDPAVQLAAIETVIPQVANHMSQCDMIVNTGEAIKTGRLNTYLGALGDEMLRSDKNHLDYGIPSFMAGMVYAMTICGVKPSDLVWYPTGTDEGQIGVISTAFLSYLAKQCAMQATLQF